MAQKAKPDRHHYERQKSAGWYFVLRKFFGLLFHTLWPLKTHGVENVPRNEAAVIVCNHLSMIDPFVVGYSARRLVSFMAKEELFSVPVVGFLIRKVGAFPVDRARRDPATMRTAMQVLKEGDLLGMFPEGTRSTTGEMLELRAGAARLASRTKTVIVPAAVINTDRALPPGKMIRPARISVRYGVPFHLTELEENPKDDATLHRALEQIRERIEALHESGK